MNTQLQDILNIIKRGSAEVIYEDELITKIERNKPLRVKAGFDPTAPDLHIGHTVLLNNMSQFQSNSTQATAGSLTRDSARPPFTRSVDDVASRFETDLEQGLHASEIKNRRSHFGWNRLTETPPVSGWKKFLPSQAHITKRMAMTEVTAISLRGRSQSIRCIPS